MCARLQRNSAQRLPTLEFCVLSHPPSPAHDSSVSHRILYTIALGVIASQQNRRFFAGRPNASALLLPPQFFCGFELFAPRPSLYSIPFPMAPGLFYSSFLALTSPVLYRSRFSFCFIPIRLSQLSPSPVSERWGPTFAFKNCPTMSRKRAG